MKKLYFLFISIFLILFTTAFIVTSLRNNARANFDVINSTVELKTFHNADLAPYNGNDPNKPIYIGFDGLVYDVSSGKFFYDSSGVYHYLAGRDSTKELNVFGGTIIKQKYPVIGKLVD